MSRSGSNNSLDKVSHFNAEPAEEEEDEHLIFALHGAKDCREDEDDEEDEQCIANKYHFNLDCADLDLVSEASDDIAEDDVLDEASGFRSGVSIFGASPALLSVLKEVAAGAR
jgi:hypothetical protein